MNLLYCDDNLSILRKHIGDGSVDLIYLDPPFNTNITQKSGDRGFVDTWRWDDATAEAYQEIVETGGRPSQAMRAFRQFLGDSNMLAYLAMMAPRLIELRRVLKPTGSIYLHCNPAARHYLKMLMDAVFGLGNFVNEIIWNYISGGGAKNAFARKHGIILFYAKYMFNCMQDVLWRIPNVNSQAKERLGYPTQKPEALLERIIKASSNEGDTVLDPFCGCGTTMATAQKLGRKWIGIDINKEAIDLARKRLDRISSGIFKADYEYISSTE